jgi:CRP-like cAMP-binding protein
MVAIPVLKTKQKPAFDADAFLRFAGTGKTVKTFQATDVIFSQGDAADSVLYIQKGVLHSPSTREPRRRVSAMPIS